MFQLRHESTRSYGSRTTRCFTENGAKIIFFLIRMHAIWWTTASVSIFFRYPGDIRCDQHQARLLTTPDCILTMEPPEITCPALLTQPLISQNSFLHDTGNLRDHHIRSRCDNLPLKCATELTLFESCPQTGFADTRISPLCPAILLSIRHHFTLRRKNKAEQTVPVAALTASQAAALGFSCCFGRAMSADYSACLSLGVSIAADSDASVSTVSSVSASGASSAPRRCHRRKRIPEVPPRQPWIRS